MNNMSVLGIDRRHPAACGFRQGKPIVQQTQTYRNRVLFGFLAPVLLSLISRFHVVQYLLRSVRIPMMRHHHHAPVTKWIGNLGFEPKNIVKISGGQHLVSRSATDNLPVLHGDQIVCNASGKIQLVQHHNHGGAAFFVQVRQ